MIAFLSILLVITTVAAFVWRRSASRERFRVAHWQSECQRQINIGARQYERLCKAQDDLKAAVADADSLAASVREYVKQMDEYSMKLGDEPCSLSREREALSLHQKLKESKPCPPSPS